MVGGRQVTVTLAWDMVIASHVGFLPARPLTA